MSQFNPLSDVLLARETTNENAALTPIQLVMLGLGVVSVILGSRALLESRRPRTLVLNTPVLEVGK